MPGEHHVDSPEQGPDMASILEQIRRGRAAEIDTHALAAQSIGLELTAQGLRVGDIETFVTALQQTTLPQTSAARAGFQEYIGNLLDEGMYASGDKILTENAEWMFEVTQGATPPGVPGATPEETREQLGSDLARAFDTASLVRNIGALEAALNRLNIPGDTISRLHLFGLAAKEGRLPEWALLDAMGTLTGSLIEGPTQLSHWETLFTVLDHLNNTIPSTSLFLRQAYRRMRRGIQAEQASVAFGGLTVLPAIHDHLDMLHRVEEILDSLSDTTSTTAEPSEPPTASGESVSVQTIHNQVAAALGELSAGTVPILEAQTRLIVAFDLIYIALEGANPTLRQGIMEPVRTTIEGLQKYLTTIELAQEAFDRYRNET